MALKAWILWVIIVVATLRNANSKLMDDQECGLLETTEYRLDFQCLNQPKAAGVSHKLIASSKEACKKACCDWAEGTCDVAYWDHKRNCRIMNYYVIGICPLLATTILPQHSQYIPSQYVMLRVTTDINAELKKHLKFRYKERIKHFLKCDPTDVLCSNWDCINKKYDCDGVNDCLDGSDEICINMNHTHISSQPHCIDKDGQVVLPGSYFVRKEMSDPCEKCKCLTDGSQTCYNIQCAVSCSHGMRKQGACCECETDIDDSYLNMSSTQRLVVSCMSVLAVVSMLLFFSRNILQRRNGRTNNNNLRNWINRRNEHLNGVNDEENYSGYYLGGNDLPPPYVLVKPPEESSQVDDSIPPPSYNQVVNENNGQSSEVHQGNSTEGAEENEIQSSENDATQNQGSPQTPLMHGSNPALN